MTGDDPLQTLNISRMLRKVATAASLPKPWCICRHWLLTWKEFPYLKGVMFERTGRRNNLYFWNFILPTFHPGSTPILNFSERLNNGYTVDGCEEEIVARAAACILDTPRLVDSLQAAEPPSDFLDRHPVPIKFPENAPAAVVFDLAASAALAGRTETAIRLIRSLYGRTNLVPNETIAHYTELLLSAIQQGSDVTPLLKRISDNHKKF